MAKKKTKKSKKEKTSTKSKGKKKKEETPTVGKANLSKARERHKSHRSKFRTGDLPFWKPKEGKNKIRIMPPFKGREDFMFPVAYHYNVGPDGQKACLCPNYTAGKKCAICEAIDKEEAKPKDKRDKEWVSDVRAKAKTFFCIVDVNDKKAGVQILGAGIQITDGIMEYLDEDTGYGDITDFKTGRDVIIKMKKKGGGNRNISYSVVVAAKQSALRTPEKYIPGILDLEEIFEVPSYKETKALLEGEDPEDAEDEDLEEEEIEEEEVEEGDDEEEEEDEEEEDEDDDEDEEEDEEEDEDDEDEEEDEDEDDEEEEDEDEDEDDEEEDEDDEDEDEDDEDEDEEEEDEDEDEDDEEEEEDEEEEKMTKKKSSKKKSTKKTSKKKKGKKK